MEAPLQRLSASEARLPPRPFQMRHSR